MVSFFQPMADPKPQAEAERIHHAWNDALAAKDVEVLSALYAEDAAIESPMISCLLGTDEGIVRGREAMRIHPCGLQAPAEAAPDSSEPDLQ